MKQGVMTCLTLLGGAIALVGWAPAPVLAGANTITGQVIVDWNSIASQNMSGSTLRDIREFAILHVAVYDAVVSITRDHDPYQFAVHAPSRASAEAAAIAAAHAVLVALHPDNVSTLDAQYASALAALPDGQPKLDGVAVGEQVLLPSCPHVRMMASPTHPRRSQTAPSRTSGAGLLRHSHHPLCRTSRA